MRKPKVTKKRMASQRVRLADCSDETVLRPFTVIRSLASIFVATIMPIYAVRFGRLSIGQSIEIV